MGKIVDLQEDLAVMRDMRNCMLVMRALHRHMLSAGCYPQRNYSYFTRSQVPKLIPSYHAASACAREARSVTRVCRCGRGYSHNIANILLLDPSFREPKQAAARLSHTILHPNHKRSW